MMHEIINVILNDRLLQAFLGSELIALAALGWWAFRVPVTTGDKGDDA